MIKQLRDALTALLAHSWEAEDGELPVELSMAFGSFADMGHTEKEWESSLSILTDEGFLIRGHSESFATISTNVNGFLRRSP